MISNDPTYHIQKRNDQNTEDCQRAGEPFASVFYKRYKYQPREQDRGDGVQRPGKRPRYGYITDSADDGPKEQRYRKGYGPYGSERYHFGVCGPLRVNQRVVDGLLHLLRGSRWAPLTVQQLAYRHPQDIGQRR